MPSLHRHRNRAGSDARPSPRTSAAQKKRHRMGLRPADVPTKKSQPCSKPPCLLKAGGNNTTNTCAGVGQALAVITSSTTQAHAYKPNHSTHAATRHVSARRQLHPSNAHSTADEGRAAHDATPHNLASQPQRHTPLSGRVCEPHKSIKPSVHNRKVLEPRKALQSNMDRTYV